MILRYVHLSRHPAVFLSLTGLRVPEFDAVVAELLPGHAAGERARLARPDRRRAIGAGHPFELRPHLFVGYGLVVGHGSVIPSRLRADASAGKQE